MESLVPTTELPRLPPRPSASHKGTYGHVLVIGGSEGMSGAAVLAGCAALRGGAGLVTVACPRNILASVATYEPSYLTLPLPHDDIGRIAAESLPILVARTANVLAIGPGCGPSIALAQVLAGLLTQRREPMVVDADALNVLVDQQDLLTRRLGTTVLTPHPGEFARLCGTDTATIQADRQGFAPRFAQAHRCLVVLKGHETLITDGHRLAVNGTGNPGMATGGSGDVLTGLLAALLAQGMEPFDAARLAVHVHGLAGDLAADAGCQASLIATDLLQFLPLALRGF